MSSYKKIDNVASYYKEKWKIFERWWHAGETLGIHYAYYDKNVKNFKDAIFRMNELIGELLGLENKKSVKILDAGCGIGGTSIYLGKKYPNVQFTGITITHEQVEMGERFVNENNLKNVKIILGDFNKTDFPSNYFDGVFAIESVAYTEHIENFIIEMHRILKPGGRLVVLDGFQTKAIVNPVLKKINKSFLFGRGYQGSGFPHIVDYIESLEKNGFKNINYKDISKNVAKSQIRGIIIGIPFFFSYMIKKIFRRIIYILNL